MTLAPGRARMVAAMAADGVRDPRVLAAMDRVPREVFVPHFWVGSGPDARAFDLNDERVTRVAEGLVYDMDRALAVRWDPARSGEAMSTASAPRLMASMLELLELSPGTRVLEIGTGTGYHVALLCELLGDPSLVTSIDIDPDLVGAAAVRLERLGYGGAHLVEGDGAAGAAQLGPFDRVVATVGCIDLAPSWFDQLAPGGFMLVPLQHGAVHPLVRATPSGAGRAEGAIVGRSGFVGIRGRQAARSVWVGAAPPPATAEASPPRPVGGGPGRLWDIGFYLALCDPRAGPPAGLFDRSGSGAALTGTSGVSWFGPEGVILRDRLVSLVAEWEGLGRPRAESFACRFAATTGPGSLGRTGPSEWVIDRIDYRQVLTLSR